MSEIKKSLVYYFVLGKFEYKFIANKENIYIKHTDILRNMHDIAIPREELKKAIKKIEDYKIKKESEKT